MLVMIGSYLLDKSKTYPQTHDSVDPNFPMREKCPEKKLRNKIEYRSVLFRIIWAMSWEIIPFQWEIEQLLN